MNEKQLTYFLRIAEEGSFSIAAAILGVDQSSLSRNIRYLEENIGEKLFHRTGRGVTLTDTGTEFQDVAKRFLEDVEDIRQRVESGSDELRGVVSLGAVQFIGESFLPRCLARFKKTHPNVLVQVGGGGSGIIQEMLLRGRVDIGILYDTAISMELIAEPIFEDRLILFGSTRVAKRYGLSPMQKLRLPQLEDIPLITSSRRHGMRRAIDSAARRTGSRLNIVYESDSLVTSRKLAMLGEAFSITPFGAVSEMLGNPDVFGAPLDEPGLVASFSLATPRNHELKRGARELIAVIRQEFRRFGQELESRFREMEEETRGKGR